MGADRAWAGSAGAMTKRHHSEPIGGCPNNCADAPGVGMQRGCPLSPGVSRPSPSRPPPGAAEQRCSRSCLCHAPPARARPLCPPVPRRN
eukprot:3445578-Pyramimonas_sp.AAC.1